MALCDDEKRRLEYRLFEINTRALDLDKEREGLKSLLSSENQADHDRGARRYAEIGAELNRLSDEHRQIRDRLASG